MISNGGIASANELMSASGIIPNAAIVSAIASGSRILVAPAYTNSAPSTIEIATVLYRSAIAFMPSVLCYRQVSLGPFFPSAGEYSDVRQTETEQRIGYQLAVVALAARTVNDYRPVAARSQLFGERLVIVREVVAREVDRARHMPQLVK